ncbi:hypothetical protein Tco_0593493 [Tanacetum coccineum]
MGGDLGHVTIQPDFFFNKDLEYLRYGRKMGRPSLSISKMKAAYYPNVGLEQIVLDQMWIEKECKWSLRLSSELKSSHMKKIVLRRADLKEYVIAERDFKYLYPSNFEDLYLLNLQGHMNHLSPKDKKILTTVVNLWTRNLVIESSRRTSPTGDFELTRRSYTSPNLNGIAKGLWSTSMTSQ